jgi:hypothetical protein
MQKRTSWLSTHVCPQITGFPVQCISSMSTWGLILHYVCIVGPPALATWWHICVACTGSSRVREHCQFLSGPSNPLTYPFSSPHFKQTDGEIIGAARYRDGGEGGRSSLPQNIWGASRVRKRCQFLYGPSNPLLIPPPLHVSHFKQEVMGRNH